MKKLILSLVAIATISLSSFGQAPEGFKYQAVVRDAGNTILNNQAVGMRMTIQQGSIGGTTVYQETFAPTTNAYGLVNLEIGSGTVVSGDFTTIDWANGPYFIETAVDVTGGTSYAVMGTSQLRSVPYALYAKTSGSPGATVFTFNSIEPTGIQAPTNIASGYYSIAMGHNTEASGYASTAMGGNTIASGSWSTAMGEQTEASQSSSTAMGNGTIASGQFSTAMGGGAIASGYISTAMGEETEASGINSLATGGYTEASGYNSTALGGFTIASGLYSTAMGNGAIASGEYSTAMGVSTNASGHRSTAMGNLTIASGLYSTAMGDGVDATGIGELYNSGNVKGLSFISTSDKRVKQNIAPFSGALSKVMLLSPKTYFYNTEAFPRFEAEKDKPQIGFIAQEVELIFPEMVATDGDEVGLKGVRYGQLTAVLVQAIKEMQQDYQSQIDELQKEINKLKTSKR